MLKFKPPIYYKGWEITHTGKSIFEGASATKNGIRSEYFWNPNALENLKAWIDKQK